MLPYLTEKFGNPSSRQHAFGQEAHAAVEEARAHVAAPHRGRARGHRVHLRRDGVEQPRRPRRGAGRRGARPPRRHHRDRASRRSSSPCRTLEREGFEVTVVGVGRGRHRVRRTRSSARCGRTPSLVSVMAANNEIGTIQPVAAIGRLCRERGIVVPLRRRAGDRTCPRPRRRVGCGSREPLRTQDVRPQGCGRALRPASRDARASASRPRPKVADRKRDCARARSTCRASSASAKPRVWPARPWPAGEAERVAALRDRLLSGLRARLDGVEVNGALDRRLPGNLHVSDRARGSGDLDPLARAAGSRSPRAPPARRPAARAPTS